MPGNEQLWALLIYYAAYGGAVLAGVASNVGHHHVALLDLEPEHLTVAAAYLLPVDVAVHGAHGAMAFQLVYDKLTANVAGMPYLVAVGKMDQVLVVPPAMGVRQQAYSLHSPKRCFM